MRDFSRAPGRLAALPLPARVVYTVFLAFTLAAMALTAWLADDMVGLGGARFGSYYAGTPEPGAASGVSGGAGEGGGAGPVLDMPDEPETPIAEAMPRRKLLEVTHFHLFSMPVYLLILSHLFMLSTLGNGAKIAWISVASASTALHVAAPWIAASGAAGAGWVYGLSGVALGGSYLVLSLVPLREMWARGGGARTKPPGGGAPSTGADAAASAASPVEGRDEGLGDR